MDAGQGGLQRRPGGVSRPGRPRPGFTRTRRAALAGATTLVVLVSVPSRVGAGPGQVAPTTAPAPAPTLPPATDPPATDPPATDPPATDPPATDPPATVPPTSAPSATVVPGTTPPDTGLGGTSVPPVDSSLPDPAGTLAPGPAATTGGGSSGGAVRVAVSEEEARTKDAAVDEGVATEAPQMAFDPVAAQAKIAERRNAAALRTMGTRAGAVAAQTKLVAALRRFDEVRADLATVEKGKRRRIDAAARRRVDMRDRAVNSWIRSSSPVQLAVLVDRGPVEAGRATEMLRSVAVEDRRAVQRYRAAAKVLDSRARQLLDRVDRTGADLKVAAAEADAARQLLGVAEMEWMAYTAGSQVFVQGFVFPVAAPVDFIDSWGYPRMSGTSSAHWHQGTDVMAARGAPLIASENGRIAKLGSASLGGNKLWVKGDSGTSYYYAHLQAFVPGMANGDRVCAGQLVGFLGDSGNARGTPPHVHFEIHPRGGDAVNPYPMLALAWAAQKGALSEGPVVDPALDAETACPDPALPPPGSAGGPPLTSTPGAGPSPTATILRGPTTTAPPAVPPLATAIVPPTAAPPLPTLFPPAPG